MKKLYALLAAAVVASGAAYAAPAKVKAEFKLMQPATETPAMVKNFSGASAQKAPSRAEGETPNIAGTYTCYFSQEGKNYYDDEMTFTAKGDNKYVLNYLIFDNAANLECEVKYIEDFWAEGEGQWAVVFDGTTPVFYEDLSDYASYGFTNNEPFYLGLSKGNQFSTMETMEWAIDGETLLWPYAEGYSLTFYSRIIDKVGAVTYKGLEKPNFYLQNTKMETKEEDDTETMVDTEYNFFTEPYDYEGVNFILAKGFAGWSSMVAFVVNAEAKTATAYEQTVLTDDTYGDFYITSGTETMELTATLSEGENGNTVMTIADPWAVYVPKVEAAYGFYSDTKVYLPFNALATTGVSKVENDTVEGPAVYYNLQGQQVQNPAAGLYIVRQGNKATKVLVK